MDIEIKHYDELTKDDLYAILQLRAKVFVVEQNCPYVDPDGKDQEAWHVLMKCAGKLIGTARIFPPDVYFKKHTSIGRVVVEKTFRKRSLGKELMRKSMEFLMEKFPEYPIAISAQKYLERFYEDLGFYTEGKEYLEDGIPHVKMIFQKK